MTCKKEAYRAVMEDNFALGRLGNLSFLHENHMLGPLDLTGSECWASFIFP